MTNRVGGEYFDDFASVAKSAGRPDELTIVISDLRKVRQILDNSIAGAPYGPGQVAAELGELYTRVDDLLSRVEGGHYGSAAAKLQPIVAALVASAQAMQKKALGDPSEPIDMTDMHAIEHSQIPEPSTEWEVVVGNVGTVYSGPDEDEARAIHGEYRQGGDYGRAAGEEVTLIHNGEIVDDSTAALSGGRYADENTEYRDIVNQNANNSVKSSSDRKRAFLSAYIKKAAITVAQGQDEQGFHMLVNMNGREYALRGDDADKFRKEYAAIPKPQGAVNGLVEKYMGALKPYKRQTVPVAPGVLEKEQQETRAKGLADADNYWQGKDAPTPQEEKRYMTQHASEENLQRFSSLDMLADYVKHDSENRGQAEEFEPLTGIEHEAAGEKSDVSRGLLIGELQAIPVGRSGQFGEYQVTRSKPNQYVVVQNGTQVMAGTSQQILALLPRLQQPVPVAASSDGEFSDIGGVKPLKVTAAEFQEGDEVRGHLPSGVEFPGAIESINGNDVVIKSDRGPKRTFKMKDITPGKEYDLKVQHNIQRQKQDQAEEAEAAKGKKRDDRIENSVTINNPTGSAGQMVPELQRRGYLLTLKYKADQYLDQAQSEWEEWTGGEQLGEECVKQYNTMYGREWTLVYSDPNRDMPVFFEVEPMGIHEGKRSPKPIGLSQKDRVVVNYPEIIGELVKVGLRMNCESSTQELRTSSMTSKKAYTPEEINDPSKMKWLPYTRDGEQYWMDKDGVEQKYEGADTKKACGDSCAEVDEEVTLPASMEVEGQGGKSLPPAETAVETEKEAGFNFFFPGQVMKEFYPELQHEIVDYPNDNNSPMIEDVDPANMTGELGDRDWAFEASLDSALDTPKLSYVPKYADSGSNYVSTAPGAIGIGRDGKPQVLDGAPLRKENDIRGGMFMDEFHQQYDGVPGAMLSVASKVAAGEEKQQFNKFLKLVMGEIAASLIAAFKVTSRPILNKAPGVGEVQLDQVEQPSSLSTFNLPQTGSRVKYLLDKINDGDIKEAINGARAQAAVWLDDPDGGYVYEVFARAESIDTDSMKLKYTFVTGTRESE